MSGEQEQPPNPNFHVFEQKRQGRRRIPIEFITDRNRRQITFSKRKSGIMKKAFELSTLTGTEVMLLVASETGHVYTFATPKLRPLIKHSAGRDLIQACLKAPNPEDVIASQFPPSFATPNFADHDAGHHVPTHSHKVLASHDLAAASGASSSSSSSSSSSPYPGASMHSGGAGFLPPLRQDGRKGAAMSRPALYEQTSRYRPRDRNSSLNGVAAAAAAAAGGSSSSSSRGGAPAGTTLPASLSSLSNASFSTISAAFLSPSAAAAAAAATSKSNDEQQHLGGGDAASAFEVGGKGLSFLDRQHHGMSPQSLKLRMIDQTIMRAVNELWMVSCPGVGLLLRKLAKLNSVDLDVNCHFTVGTHVDPDSSFEIEVSDFGEIVTAMFFARRSSSSSSSMMKTLHESYTFVRGEELWALQAWNGAYLEVNQIYFDLQSFVDQGVVQSLLHPNLQLEQTRLVSSRFSTLQWQWLPPGECIPAREFES